MKQGRIHIRLDDRLTKRIKRYASRRHVTVTALVEQFFRHLLEEEEEQAQQPVDAEQI